MSAGTYLARTPGLLLVKGLQRFLDRQIRFQPFGPPRAGTEAVIGWGLKGVALKGKALAERHGLPYLALEDGFLRSVLTGDVDAPLSLVLDDVGIYYRGDAPSRLEHLIAAGHSPDQLTRAEALAQRWCEQRVSKYNHAREQSPPSDEPFVLVVDQTAGDASIHHGLADATSFTRMLEAALDEHPRLPVVLKVHPDVVAGRKRAHFGALAPAVASRVTLLAGNVHAPALLQAAAAVYVVTSQMGFEALMWRRPVRCFGMPFYAGWGLTQDDLPGPARRGTGRAVSLASLVHAALIDYPRYIDPETGQRCTPERLIDWMGLQRRQRERFAPAIQTVAFSEWKQPIARDFLAGSALHFVGTAQPLAAGAARAVWGRPAEGDAAVAGTDSPLLRVEDGFLRSVGLGANWVRPLSWVIDQRGMYYDATAPSDLEHLLQTTAFDDTLLARAAALRQAIVAARVTKYNVGSGRWQRPAGQAQVVLVPGQVESDASIAWGAPGVRTNLDLLRAVRESRPSAWIVYKPHPDVLAGTRAADAQGGDVRPWCNEVVTDVAIHALFAAVDEVQVITSLAGFEALLRGLPVVCHGCPFYAGWGLTTDHHPNPRRTRELSLDALVAAALILYPTYVSRTSGAFTTAERALHELANWDATAPPADPQWQRLLRRLKRWRARRRQL
jgi:capsular polysaccharide export protein